MSPRQRRWILAIGGVLTVAIVAAAVFVLLPEDAPTARGGPVLTEVAPPSAAEVADRFLAAAFDTGDAGAAAALTDDAGRSAKVLAAVRQGLAPKSVTAKRGGPVDHADGAPTAAATFTLTWTFGAQRVWTYDSALPLAKSGDQWRVRWTPELVHPKLTAERSLALRGRTGEPAVLDRDGAPLLVWQADGAKAVDAAVAPLLTPALGRVAGEHGGANGWRIALLDAAGTELEKLAGPDGTSEPTVATLSVPIQRAAQAAVDSVGQPARLVAIQPSTGDILAVAQNAAAGAEPKALNGLYPPGSTFKIATAAAALQAGAAGIDTVLACPGTATIGTRTIPNDDRFDLGDVPLRAAFARSCNTTFAKLAADLPAEALAQAAGQLGLNADFVIPGLTTEAGRVDPAGTVPQRVENGIGQGTVQASPFGVALMTATVASGKAVTPRLWRNLETTVNAGYRPPPGPVLGQLRTMMREVVTAGTGRALAGRGTVLGKTGTAQVGTGEQAHGWFTGYRGDLAWAVLVEDAQTSAPAVAVSATFLGRVR